MFCFLDYRYFFRILHTVPVPEILYVECCNVEEEDRVAVAAAVVALGRPLLRYDLAQPQHEICYEVVNAVVALGRPLLRYDLTQPSMKYIMELLLLLLLLRIRSAIYRIRGLGRRQETSKKNSVHFYYLSYTGSRLGPVASSPPPHKSWESP